MEGEACTGGGDCTGEERLVQEVVKIVVLVQERRGLYRRWCEACTGGGKESPLPGLYRERNWVGWRRTGEYENST